MGFVPWPYIMAVSVGAWLAGLGFGVILGIRLPQRITTWKDGTGFVVIGSTLVAIVLILFMLYGKQH